MQHIPRSSNDFLPLTERNHLPAPGPPGEGHAGIALRAGKLEPEQLASLLACYTTTDQRVVIGSGIGVDATVSDFVQTYLVAKTDPIPFVAEDIGFYAVTINANDVPSRGTRARWFLATVPLPEGSASKELVDTLFAQMAETCRQTEVALCGGHTEITPRLDPPIVVG